MSSKAKKTTKRFSGVAKGGRGFPAPNPPDNT